jgi:hypothetical protein
MWRAKLWWYHALLAVLIAIALSVAISERFNLASFGVWFLAAQLAVTTLFAALPQLMFKGSERTLVVNAQGWSTQIGNKSGSRTWSEVASVGEDDGKVVIAGTNGNALVIPAGAFQDSRSRKQFMDDVQRWRNAHGA